MDYETLSVGIYDHVATITLNRPPVNAVNHQMQLDIQAVFDAIGQAETIRSAVLAAQGDKAFCAGIDLKEQRRGREASFEERLNPGRVWRDAQHALRHCPVPVVAAVERPAIGAGFGLVALCDAIVASSTASFGLTEINVGLLGGASKALRMVGPYKTRIMMFTGQVQSAKTFAQFGAIEQLVEPGCALEAAQSICSEIATKSPMAVRLAKESILRIESDEVETRYRTEWDYTNRLRGFEDSKEALSAYLEGRKPQWTLS